MPFRWIRSAAVCAVVGLGLSACSSVEQTISSRPFEATTARVVPDIEQARSENLNRFVGEEYPDRVQVIAEEYGLETIREFFDYSRTLIVVENRDGALARGASIAIAQYAPMVIYDSSIHREITSLIDSLRVERVLTIGEVPFAAGTGTIEVFQDPGTDRALGELTAHRFDRVKVGQPKNLVKALSRIEPDDFTEVVAAWDRLPTYENSREHVPAIYAQARRDKEMAPVMVATDNSPVVSVANAKAFGAQVRVMPDPDPTADKRSLSMVAGLADGPLIALGSEFGSSRQLAHRIRVGEVAQSRTSG